VATAQEATVSRAEFEALKARMAEFERLVQTQQQTIANQAAQLATRTANPHSPAEAWAEHIAIHGVVEVEAGYAKTSSDDDAAEAKESDLALATVEIGIEARLSDWIAGEVVLLYEEDDTEEVTVDMGVIALGNPEASPLYLELGKMYVPFGVYDSSFITDPLTLELGETRESAARLGAVFGGLDLSISLFNGDVEDDADSHLDDFVAALTYEHAFSESVALLVGAAYATNMADSDGITDRIDEMTGGTVIRDKVSGASLFAALAIGRFGFLAEYVTALDDFAAGEILAGAEATPSAWNVEACMAVSEALSIAVKYEAGSELGDWLPEKRYGIAASYLVHEGDWGAATLSLEYMHGEYDDADNTEEDALTAQFAIEF
jgi:hypothetical protein